CPKSESPLSGFASLGMLSAAVVILLATFLYMLISALNSSVGVCRVLQRFHTAFRFNGFNFGQTTKVPFLLRLFGAHKCANKFMCQRFANHATSQDQHIHVIVLDALVRGVRVVAQAGANTSKLVRGHGGTDTASADQYGALHALAENRHGNGFRKIRIVDRRRVTRAKIFHGVSQAAQIFGNFSLKRKSGMVGSDGNAHGHFTCASCALAASKTWPVVNPNSFCSTFNG